MEDVENGKLEEVGSVFEEAGDGSVAVTEEEVPSSPEAEGEQKVEPQPEAETKPQEAEVKPEEKKPEAKPEEETSEDTPLAQLLRDGKVVPLPEHIKLRQKKQVETNLRITAEARIAELEKENTELKAEVSRKTTPTAEVKEAGEEVKPTDVIELDGSLKDLSDDDYLPDMTKKDLQNMLQKTVEIAEKRVISRIEQKQSDERLQKGVDNVLMSEAEFEKITPDYKMITSTAQQIIPLNATEKAAILRSDNPAKTYYEISKQKISTLRMVFGTSNNVQPNLQEENKEIETRPKEGSTPKSQDDKIADELFDDE